MNNAIYPGSFDPITNGHLDIIRRASKLYDNLFIAVSNDSSIKSKLFTVQDRMDLVHSATKDIDNVKIIDFDCLIVDLCKKYQSNIIIRGLRALSDYDFEFKMALMNRSLNDEIVTLFMMPHERYTHISSSLIKEVASHGGDISKYVPSFVNKALGEIVGYKANFSITSSWITLTPKGSKSQMHSHKNSFWLSLIHISEPTRPY